MATKNPTRVGRLILLPQVASGDTPAYSNPQSVSNIASSGQTIECEITVPNVERSVFTRESIKSGFFELNPISGDQHGQEFTVRFPLNGWSDSLPTASPNSSTTQSSHSIFQAILGKAVFMDPNSGSPGTAAGTPDTDTIPYTAGQTYKVGSAVGLYGADADAVNRYGMSFIKEDASDELDLLVASDVTPAAASSIYGSITCYDDPVETTCYSMLWQSYTANSRLLFTSAIPTSVSVVFDPRSALMAEVTFMTNTVEDASSGASTLGEFSYSLPIIQPPSGGNNARLVFQNSTAGTAATDLDCEAFTMTLTQELVPAQAPGATTGVRDMIVVNRTQEVTFSVLLGDKTPYDQTPDGKPLLDLSNPSTVGAMQLAVGDRPGRMLGVLIPKPVMMAVPSMTDLNGVFAQSYTLRAGDFQNSNSGTGDAKGSNFRVAFV